MKNTLKNRIFETPLGQVVCGIDSTSSIIEFITTNNYENGQSETFRIGGYKIELIEFKIRQPLYNGENVTDSKGWIWRIEKVENSVVKLEIKCELTNPIYEVEFDSASGEHLDAIVARNKHWSLHIGTEDGEIMNSRAETNDWFPKRHKNKVNFYQSITEMNKNGFVTKIPDLRIGEKLHIQFICAFDKIIEETNHGSTCLAVDEFKRKLENWIGII